mgnify:CR=1 FL=1
MQPELARRHRRLVPGTIALLALATAVEARAGTATGSLAVSVEVVESCRVTSAGDTSELVACGSRAPAAVAAKGRAGSTARGAVGSAPRVVIEPAADGPGWLTVLY